MTCEYGHTTMRRFGPRAGKIRGAGQVVRPARRRSQLLRSSDRVTSLPDLPQAVKTPATKPPAPDALLGRPDGCPECVLNVEAPIKVYPNEGGYVATYICSDCGHDWWTTWGDR